MKITMQYLAASLALLTTGHALTCLLGGPEGKAWGPDCSNATSLPLANACYIPVNSGGGSDTGCLPQAYAGMVDISEPGCTTGGCWCLTDNCNTQEWATQFFETYKPPPQCWTGIAGANLGSTCGKSQLYQSTEYKMADCSTRSISNQCVENNKGMGMGDGCNDHPPPKDQSSCESIANPRGETRKPDDSYDGSDRHCRWVPKKTQSQKQGNCEVDIKCKFYADRGDCSTGNCTGNCENSDGAKANETTWQNQRGKDCEMRLKIGCFENNNWFGDAEHCRNHKSQSACLAQIQGHGGSSCSDGVCSGNASSGQACSDRTMMHECSGMMANNCTWKSQCCQWLPEPLDHRDTCMNSGKGSLDGVCSYSDGIGPPGKDIVEGGFEHGLFIKGNKFTGQCALIASFRNGSGSATALGSNQADLLGNRCKGSAPWKGVAEHVGHTTATIDEYCTNFIPDSSVMAALKDNSPSFIIEKVEQGQFDAVFPGLVGLKFIVTAKPAFGKCLFFASEGKWGASVCTCDKAECNGNAALGLIVDGDTGPMRLLQFIDGSLVDIKDEVNGRVADLMSADGKINLANVGKVTEADVIELMKLEGISKRTNKDELWNITQDYQKLLKAEADYKAALLAYPIFKALKIDASKVMAANNAAGIPLYFGDGIPMTFSLQGLSDNSVTAVSSATGISEPQIKEARTQAWNKEHGIALTTTTTTTTGKPPTQPPATLVTSVGKVEVKMSKADATALTTKPEAKTAFASAIAKTINVSASDVEIIGIYVDGVLVAARRLSVVDGVTTESTVRVDWRTTQEVAVQMSAINANTLQTNIEVEAKAVANVTIAITATPTVTVTVEPQTTTTPFSLSAASSNWCLASSVLMCILLGLLP